MFMVSDQGRIMRIPYWAPMPHGGVRAYGGQPYCGVWEPEQERYIIQHKRRTYKIARLVCEAFHGEPKPGKRYCLHRDENSRNNRASNLAWGTQKQNLNAPGFIDHCRSRTGENSNTARGRKKKLAAKYGIKNNQSLSIYR